jgi:hypothetical protein
MHEDDDNHDHESRQPPCRTGPSRQPFGGWSQSEYGGAGSGVEDAYRVCDDYMRRGHSEASHYHGHGHYGHAGYGHHGHHGHHGHAYPAMSDWNHWNDPHNVNNAMRYYSHFMNMWMAPFVRLAQSSWDMNPWFPGAGNPFMQAYSSPPHPCREAWRPHPPEPCGEPWYADEGAPPPEWCEPPPGESAPDQPKKPGTKKPSADDPAMLQPLSPAAPTQERSGTRPDARRTDDFHEPEEWPDPFASPILKCGIDAIVLSSTPQTVRGTLRLHTNVAVPMLNMLGATEGDPLRFRTAFFSRLGNQVVLSVDLDWNPGTYHGLVLDEVTKQQAGTVEIVVSSPTPG